MRVLVTGAGGFVGSRVLRELRKGNGYEIHACGRGETGADLQIHWHALDLLQENACWQLVEKVRPTHLVHLAWTTRHGHYWHDESNLNWLYHSSQLFRAFIENGGKSALIAGSCAEYMSRSHSHGTTMAQVPHSLYGACKYALHLVCRQMSAEANITLAWARLFMLYGPGESRQRLVPYLISTLSRGESPVCGPGDLVRDYLYVDDAASAITALITTQANGAFDVGMGKGVTMREVGDMIADATASTARPNFGARAGKTNEPHSLVANVEPLVSVTGWQPRYTFVEGIREYMKRINEGDE